MNRRRAVGNRRNVRAGRDRRAVAEAGPAPALAGSPEGALVTAAAVLIGLGVLAMYSAAVPLAGEGLLPPHFVDHALGVTVGALLAFGASRVPLRVWRRASLPLWGFAVLLLVATWIFGADAKGAQRWLPIPGTDVRFQPVDLAKFATVLALAHLLALRPASERRSWRAWVAPFALMAVPSLILVQQPDFGNAVLLAVIAGLVAFVAGAPLRVFAMPGGAAAVAAAGYIATHPYALARVKAFLDPWGSHGGAGYQLVQSFVAFGRGGFTGVGVGDGRQKLGYLPEAHTDFILPVIGEELGLVGTLAVLGAFAALLLAGMRIALQGRDLFQRLAAFGMTAFLAVPAVVNVAVVTGLLPPKGLSLPLLSYGRSSLLVCFVALGILVRLCRGETPAGGGGAAGRSAGWTR